MKILQAEFKQLLQAEEQSKQDVLQVFESLGYKIDITSKTPNHPNQSYKANSNPETTDEYAKEQ